MSQTPVTPALLLSVATGSALGGIARYALTAYVGNRVDIAFPLGTLVVNLSGCLLLGGLVSLIAGRTSPTVQLLLTTGFCGGFTTFSTFSYEAVLLLQNGLWQRAISYVGVSMVGGLAAFALGLNAVRALLPSSAVR